MEDFVKQSSIVPHNFTYKPGPLIFGSLILISL